MTDLAAELENSLAEMSKKDWLMELSRISEAHGHFQPLGSKHFSTYIAGNDTLLVTFETYDSIQRISGTGHPFGWLVAKEFGWSSLTVISDGQSWFRDRHIYAYFDDLIDDGFFEEFDPALFYGAGPCGYAAGAYSIASPGARVLMVQPQATLDPRVAEWDERFTRQRRLDFTSRYGYAPDMIDGADKAYVLYDPDETEDAMHAALFTRPNVTKVRTRYLGTTIQHALRRMRILMPLLKLMEQDRLDTLNIARLMRARRENRHYLRNLLRTLEDQGRTGMTLAMLKNVTGRMTNVPAFEHRLSTLESSLGDG